MNKHPTFLLSRGFSLVELMVAIAIGLFLVAGVFTAYVNGKRSQSTVDDQVVMVDNARFALETIGADLRQAGVYGRVFAKSDGTAIMNVNSTTAPAMAVECVAGWTFDIVNPVQAFDANNPYGGACNTDYRANTDVLEMRGTLRDAVVPADLQAGRVYLNSDVNNAQLFAGTASPNISPQAQNYLYYAVAYYVSNFSDRAAAGPNPSDGIPSLHRVALQPDGTITDQVLLSGVEDLQVQIGLDTNGDGSVDQYVNPNVANWGQARSVQVWLVMRAEGVEPGLTTSKTVNDISGNPMTFPNDGRRRIAVSTSVRLRNINLNT
jgi:type IV pilus assembly protein PilW